MNFKEKLPQNAGNRISEVLDFKISRGRIPPDPPTSARVSASVNQNTGSALVACAIAESYDIVEDSERQCPKPLKILNIRPEQLNICRMVIASARDLGVCTFPLLEIWTKI
jgi:hypothetical protein